MNPNITVFHEFKALERALEIAKEVSGIIGHCRATRQYLIWCCGLYAGVVNYENENPEDATVKQRVIKQRLAGYSLRLNGGTIDQLENDDDMVQGWNDAGEKK